MINLTNSVNPFFIKFGQEFSRKIASGKITSLILNLLK